MNLHIKQGTIASCDRLVAIIMYVAIELTWEINIITECTLAQND